MLPASELGRYLGKVDRAFGIDRILGEGADTSRIVQYYTKSRIGYQLFHSKRGAMHMTLSTRPDDLGSETGQAAIVEQLAGGMPNPRILELGCGTGFNLHYLSSRMTNASLVGIDLTPLNIATAAKRKWSSNAPTLLEGDFQTLPTPASSFDFVFEVEAVCHASDSKRVFGEVARVLAPGGMFVVFDGFRSERFADFSPELQLAARLVEKAMAVSQFPPVSEWLRHAEVAGLQNVRTVDLSDAIMPNLERFQTLARGFFKYKILGRLFKSVFPPDLIENSVAGLLLPFTISAGIHRYHQLVFQKGRSLSRE